MDDQNKNKIRANLGVLVVHGIGEQKLGQSLESASNAIIDSLDVMGVVYERFSSDPKGDPPTFDLSVHGKPWLLAECHWADSFLEPNYRQLVSWAVLALPTALMKHYGRFVSKARSDKSLGRKIFKTTIAIIRYLLAAAVMPVICLLLVLVNALAFVPGIGSVAKSARKTMTVIAGDALVFTDNQVQEVAILKKFRTRLEWLAERVDGPLVILAHSQGAAVSRLGLFQWDVPELRKRLHLYTYGSGLVKLMAVKRMRSGLWWYPWLSTIGIFVMFAAIFLLRDTSLAGALLLGTGGAWLTWLGLNAHSESGRLESMMDPTQLFDPKRMEGFKWTDVYSTHDPVPGGPMFETNPDYLTSKEVCNRNSIVADHTAYWGNTDEFVAGVTTSLLREADVELSEGVDGALERASKRRRYRVFVLSVIFGLVMLSTLLTLFLSLRGSNVLGDSIKLSGAKLMERIPSEQVTERMQLWQSIPNQWLSTVIILLLGLFGYRVLKWLWSKWDGIDSKDIFKNQNYGHSGYEAVFLLLFLVLLRFQFSLIGFEYPAVEHDFAIWVVCIMTFALIADAWMPMRPTVEPWMQESEDDLQWRFDDAVNRFIVYTILILSCFIGLEFLDADLLLSSVLPAGGIHVIAAIFLAGFTRWLVRALLRKSARYHGARIIKRK